MDDFTLFSDEELVSLFKNGSERAFEELYGRYSPRLKRLIYRYVQDGDAVHDIFHDTLMRVIRHIGTFNVRMSFASWIYQIAVNCTRNHHRKHARDRTLVQKESARIAETGRGTPSPDDEVMEEEDRLAFDEAVYALGDKFRDVFILRYDHEMKYQDIAAALEISERTAKWRMKAAVERIALHLKEKGVI